MTQFLFCALSDVTTYARCPSNVNSYDYYCYAITTVDVAAFDVYERCTELGGLPVWVNDSAEFSWLSTVLDAYSVDCFHLGTVK